jgi:hypothetical protein
MVDEWVELRSFLKQERGWRKVQVSRRREREGTDWDCAVRVRLWCKAGIWFEARLNLSEEGKKVQRANKWQACVKMKIPVTSSSR